MVALLGEILLAAAAFVAPGLALVACTDARWAWPLRLLVAFTLGVLVVPLATFSAAWALATSVTAPLVAATASLLTALALIVARFRPRRACAPQGPGGTPAA
jgi:hypothetical protein